MLCFCGDVVGQLTRGPDLVVPLCQTMGIFVEVLL